MGYRNININVMIPTTALLKPVKKGADVSFYGVCCGLLITRLSYMHLVLDSGICRKT